MSGSITSIYASDGIIHSQAISPIYLPHNPPTPSTPGLHTPQSLFPRSRFRSSSLTSEGESIYRQFIRRRPTPPQPIPQTPNINTNTRPKPRTSPYTPTRLIRRLDNALSKYSETWRKIRHFDLEAIERAKTLEQRKTNFHKRVWERADGYFRSRGLERGYVASLLVEIKFDEVYFERERLIVLWQGIGSEARWLSVRWECLQKVLRCAGRVARASSREMIVKEGDESEGEVEYLGSANANTHVMSKYMMELMSLDMAYKLWKGRDRWKDELEICVDDVGRVVINEMKRELREAMNRDWKDTGAWEMDPVTRRSVAVVEVWISVVGYPISA